MRYNMQRMFLLKGIFPFVAALGLTSVVNAQSITNVDANQEGKSIAVTYKLDEIADVSLYWTQDEGKTKTLIPQSFLFGDAGKKVKPGQEKKILWRVLDQFPNQDYDAKHISFIVNGKPSMLFFAMLNAGYSLDSGVNAGVTFGQLGFIGWYAKFMTTFSAPKSADYECDENGYVNGTLPAYSGNASRSKVYGVAGITVRLGAPIYLNAGVGYGTRNYAWETNDGKWVKNVPGSYSSVAIDAGIMGKLNKIALSAGVTLVKGKLDICIGVGYVF